MVTFASPYFDQTPQAQEQRKREHLRDEFAREALPFCQQVTALNIGGANHYNPVGAASLAYAYADAMLAVREGK